MQDARGMKKVIVFRNELLLPSETFIKEQALALTNWHPILMGYRRAANGLDLSALDVHILPGMASGSFRRWHTKLQQWRGKPHRPTVKAFDEVDADLLHAHFGPDAVDIWPSARAAGLPMLVTLHGYDINIHREWWESGKGGLRRRTYPHRLLSMARDPHVHFIAVSNAIKARAIQYGIPDAKVTVAYIGIDTERFKPGGLSIERRSRHILFVGRMVENKAPVLMIHAYADVRQSLPDTTLTMIGDGPLLASATQLAGELAAPVEFLGTCDPHEVLEQLQRASLLCLPSVSTPRGDAEGFGLVLLEAQACGVPVVTSALGGATEAILDGKTGYSFLAGSRAQLTERLLAVLVDPLKTAAMGMSARKHVQQQFDIKTMTNSLECAYANAQRRRT